VTTTPGSGAGSGLVVAAQILEWKSRIWEFWCQVAASLERQGQQLVLLSPWSPPTPDAGPLVLPMPYAIGEYAPNADAAMARDPGWDHLLATDALYGTFLPVSRKASLAELASLQAFVRAVFDQLAPDVVMGWAPPFPPSRLMLGEAWRREIPSFGLEIGFVPDTLMIESRDVGFGADAISHPALASTLAAHRTDEDRVARMVAAYGTRTDDQRSPWTAADRPVVVLLGSCPGFNMEPRTSRLIQLASPWFESFEAAAVAVRAAMPAGATLVLRPHPADVEGQRYSHGPAAAGIPMTTGSVRALVEQADVVAVLGSTRTQLEVALLGVPIVLLSRSLLWGQGVACEFDGRDLAGALQEALTGEGAGNRRREALRVLDFLAHHCLFGLDGTAATRGPGDFATFLGRFALAGGSPEDRQRRIAAFTTAVAPLLAPYVCREVASGTRPMRAAYLPFVEAQLADAVVRSGTATVLVSGSDATARRLAHLLESRGLSVHGFIDPVRGGETVDGRPVIDDAGVAANAAQAIVLASHDDEAGMRRRLQSVPVTRAFRLFGPSLATASLPFAPGDYVGAERLWMQRAQQAFDRQAWDASEAAARHAHEARPTWSEPIYRRALVARARAEAPDTVWALFTRALALEDVSADLVIDAGFAAFSVGDLTTADALARRAAKERPASSLPWHLRGLCARADGADVRDVARLFDRALEGEPVTPFLLMDAAQAAHGCGELARAVILAGAATDAMPEWSAPWVLRARYGAEAGAPVADVRAWYERALAAEPRPEDAVLDAGFAAFAAGDVERAEVLARDAAGVMPDSSAPWHLRALCARERGESPADVARLLEGALARVPVTAELLFDLGVAAMHRGDVEAARDFVERAAAAKPDWGSPGELLTHLSTLAASRA